MEHAADPDMVRDAKRGDEAVFTSLLRPLLEPAYRLAAAMLQGRQLAGDAVRGGSEGVAEDPSASRGHRDATVVPRHRRERVPNDATEPLVECAEDRSRAAQHGG